jgi:hypothetical protein
MEIRPGGVHKWQRDLDPAVAPYTPLRPREIVDKLARLCPGAYVFALTSVRITS